MSDIAYFVILKGTEASVRLAEFLAYNVEFSTWLAGLHERLGLPTMIEEYYTDGECIIGLPRPTEWKALPENWKYLSRKGGRFIYPKAIAKNKKLLTTIREKEVPSAMSLARRLFGDPLFCVQGNFLLRGASRQELAGRDIIGIPAALQGKVRKPKGLRPVKASTIERWKGN